MMNLIHRNRVRISRLCREILPLRSPFPKGEGFDNTHPCCLSVRLGENHFAIRLVMP